MTALSGASTGRAAGNGFKAPTLADRTLVPKAVRLVIGFKPTVTT